MFRKTQIFVPYAVLIYALFFSFQFSEVFADRIVLKEGQTITGDILVEKQTQLYIDIGITVLVVPKEKILEYEYTKEFEIEDVGSYDINDSAAKTDKTPAFALDTEQDGRLYKTANLRKTIIGRRTANT